MKLVVATDASRRLNKKLKEFHRIVNKGEVFEVTDERYRYLVGMNQFKTAFVELVIDLGKDDAKFNTTETVVSVPETEEEPEVIIIEPEVKVEEKVAEEPKHEKKPRKVKKEEPVVEEVVKEKKPRKSKKKTSD